MQLVLVYAPEPKGIFLVCLRLQREESHADKLQLLNDPLESKHFMSDNVILVSGAV